MDTDPDPYPYPYQDLVRRALAEVCTVPVLLVDTVISAVIILPVSCLYMHRCFLDTVAIRIMDTNMDMVRAVAWRVWRPCRCVESFDC